PARVVSMGRSLGGGAAADLALARPVAALVLLSSFSSASDVAWRSFRVPPFVVRDRFDNRSAVGRFDGPVLLMHGTRDDVLSFRNAERIAEGREGLDVVPLACAHNDCLSVWPETVERILDFLDQHDLR
ncbi:MAG: alpha/beta hydrolase, partial [Gemmatimonadota bacterium]